VHFVTACATSQTAGLVVDYQSIPVVWCSRNYINHEVYMCSHEPWTRCVCNNL